ncbi:hypothetical protein Tcan_17982 [Toxocara canis]|uniref:Uncharacterized protein n=1 Tax=Toxocara canis TaxID=6265 RepID=A0A0B2UNN9_TOXCA|nr:hypothetical protein Tcan_17982 [Toxocara canis]
MLFGATVVSEMKRCMSKLYYYCKDVSKLMERGRHELRPNGADRGPDSPAGQSALQSDKEGGRRYYRQSFLKVCEPVKFCELLNEEKIENDDVFRTLVFVTRKVDADTLAVHLSIMAFVPVAFTDKHFHTCLHSVVLMVELIVREVQQEAPHFLVDLAKGLGGLAGMAISVLISRTVRQEAKNLLRELPRCIAWDGQDAVSDSGHSGPAAPDSRKDEDRWALDDKKGAERNPHLESVKDFGANLSHAHRSKVMSDETEEQRDAPKPPYPRKFFIAFTELRFQTSSMIGWNLHMGGHQVLFSQTILYPNSIATVATVKDARHSITKTIRNHMEQVLHPKTSTLATEKELAKYDISMEEPYYHKTPEIGQDFDVVAFMKKRRDPEKVLAGRFLVIRSSARDAPSFFSRQLPAASITATLSCFAQFDM